MNQISTLAPPVAPPFVTSARRPPRIALICSSWHSDIVNKCKDSLLSEFEGKGLPANAVDVFDVPGAFEIPLHAQRLAQTGRYDAIVACGLVVNGGIYRHEFVAAAVIGENPRLFGFGFDNPLAPSTLAPSTAP